MNRYSVVDQLRFVGDKTETVVAIIKKEHPDCEIVVVDPYRPHQSSDGQRGITLEYNNHRILVWANNGTFEKIT